MTPEHRASPISGSRALGIFAKRPLPGQVKTRLAKDSTSEWAAQVALAFLLDSLDRWATISAHRVLAFAPPDAAPYFAEAVKGRFALSPQADGDLGRRMAVFFDQQFEVGAHRVVLVGTDSPTLPPAYIEQAFRELEQADVVVGPATDGGYYLIGCTHSVPPIFECIPWSTSQVLKATISRLKQSQLRLALLPPWYDVDTLDDWRMLQGHLAAQRRAGIDPGVPHTERLLESSNP
jgi:rSAM/selenodomain-associated transferase 1